MNRAELVTTLELVSPALANNNQVPVFECFCFDGKTVTAYRDELGIIAPCKTGDAFAVNGTILLGLLKNSHSEEVEFTVESKQEIGIKAGKSRFKLPYFPQEDFLFEKPAGKWDIEIAVEPTLNAGMEACLLSSSRDMAQPALLGVALAPYEKVMVLYSCDGDALTRCPTKAKAVDDTYMMPNSFCETYLKTAKETNASFVFIKANKDWAYAKMNSGFEIYGRLLHPDRPVDYEELIEKTIKGKAVFAPVPKGLDHALSRARVVADPESAKTVLEVGDGKLRLRTETHMGIVTDNIALPKHPDVTANVSAALMQRAIGLCDHMALLERCTAYKGSESLFVMVSNMG